MSRTGSLLAAALGTLALTAGVAAGPAAADSIVYDKGGDVWLTTPDGSRQFQVTTSGGYSSASQSDDGTIVALKGQRIHKLDRMGNVLADFSTPVSDGTDDRRTSGLSHFVGPYDLDLSDDGTKVLYNFHWDQWTTAPGSPWYDHYLRQGVGVSYSDRLTPWSEPGLGYQTGWLDASWYDGDTLLLGNPANTGMMDVSTDDLGTQTSDSKDWFHQRNLLQDMRMPAIDKRHTRIAVVGDHTSGQQLFVYEGKGEAPALPTICHGWEKPIGGSFGQPTFSPDGDGLAWTEGDGIRVSTGQQSCGSPADPKLIVPGGRNPDWGPAGVPTGRPAPPPKDNGTPPAPAPQPPVVKPTPLVKPAAPPKSTKGSTALTFSFSCRRACTVSGKVIAPAKLARQLKLPRGALATGTVKRTAKGTAVLELKLTAAGRRAVAKLAGRKVPLKVTIRDGARRRTVTRSVALK